jgi:transcriptional regulator with XRE-family HTH domain
VKAAEILRANLKARGVRPKDLAAAIDVGPSTASLMLSGKRGIRTEHLDGIAAYLHTTVSDLFRHDSVRQVDRAEGLGDGDLDIARRYHALKRNDKMRAVVRHALGVMTVPETAEPQRETKRAAVGFQKARRRARSGR